MAVVIITRIITYMNKYTKIVMIAMIIIGMAIITMIIICRVGTWLILVAPPQSPHSRGDCLPHHDHHDHHDHRHHHRDHRNSSYQRGHLDQEHTSKLLYGLLIGIRTSSSSPGF